MMKRMAAALLAAVLILPPGTDGLGDGGLVRAAEAAELEAAGVLAEEGDFRFTELANGTLKITGYTGNGAQVEIPSSIGGKSVVIIADKAFSGCSGLTSIKIPASVTNIGESASTYGNAELPVFEECSSLTEIIVDDGNLNYSSADGILYNREKTELLVCPAGKAGSAVIEDGVTDIKTQAFSLCSKLTGIKIPASVSNINAGTRYSYGAFRNCSSLEEIVVEDGNSDYYAEDGILYEGELRENMGTRSYLICCPARKKGAVAIPDRVWKISSGAFQNCADLTRIEIPGSVVNIPDNSFLNCRSLTEIIVDKSDVSYYVSEQGMLYTGSGNDDGRGILLCCPAGKSGSIVLPDGVKRIGEYAFDSCGGLTEIVIGKDIAFGSLYGDCDNPASVIFSKCSNLERIIVDISDRNYSSYDGVLYSKDMSELLCCPPGKKGSFAVPEGVTKIKIGAFYNCSYLESVTIPKSVERIEVYSDFDPNALFLNCKNLIEINVDDNNAVFCSIDGVLYVKNSDGRAVRLYICPEGKEGSITIPEGILSIGYSALRNCSKLIRIEMPKGCTQINELAFLDCNNLTSIKLPEDMASCIEMRVFSGCSSLESIELPEGINEISSGAFQDCTKLSRIYIPENVTNIAGNAFDGCGNDLCIVCVDGSAAQAYAIKKGIQYELTENRKKLQSITASDFTKKVGDMPFLIRAVSDGDGELTYKSSNESVVRVSEEGIIEIRGAGTAQITITASETAIYKASEKVITVTVNSESGSGSSSEQPEKKAYTITFDANGGTGLSEASRKIEEGNALGALPTVKRSGYILAGWYTQANGGAAVTQDTKVTSDMTVYAQWKAEIQAGTNGTGQNSGNAQKPGNTGNPNGNSDNNSKLIRKTKAAKAKIKSAKNVKTKSIKLKLSGMSGYDGYQILYGLKKNFKGAKAIAKKSGSVTIKKLKAKKTYYVRVRVYKKIAGKTYYGKWSGKKSVKINR